MKRLKWRWVRRSPTASNYKTGRRLSIEPHRRQRKSCDIPLNPRGFLKNRPFGDRFKLSLPGGRKTRFGKVGDFQQS